MSFVEHPESANQDVDAAAVRTPPDEENVGRALLCSHQAFGIGNNRVSPVSRSEAERLLGLVAALDEIQAALASRQHQICIFDVLSIYLNESTVVPRRLSFDLLQVVLVCSIAVVDDGDSHMLVRREGEREEYIQVGVGVLPSHESKLAVREHVVQLGAKHVASLDRLKRMNQPGTKRSELAQRSIAITPRRNQADWRYLD
jgi:hypothetical protein